MNDKAPESAVDVDALSTLMQLEASARRAESEKAFEFFVVNDTQKLVSYQQAFLLSNTSRGLRVLSASNIAIIDQQSPFVVWLEKVAKTLDLAGVEPQIRALDASTLPADFAGQWEDNALPFALWCPMVTPNKDILGGLWLMRDSPWTERDITLIGRLGDTYAHAWSALLRGPLRRRRLFGKRRLAILVAVVVIFALPIRLSTLAPAEIVAADPIVVTAPIDGVIKDIEPLPNAEVHAGDVLFTIEDTTLRNNLQIAEKALAVADASYQQASQGAFGDVREKSKLAVLRAELELRRTERDFAADLLDKTKIRASSEGLLLFTDAADWVGRPVTVGERVMEIADPTNIEVKLFLAVDDAIVYDENIEIDVFLDYQPLDSLKAKIVNASYHAERTPSDILAYRIRAVLIDEQLELRIGQQGTAKLYGKRVPLIYFLFRRPLSALRQSLGF